MAVVVTVMNMKGGVGKTTLAGHLAGMLALYEYRGKYRRVLAVDYDPQFNLSQMYLPNKVYFAAEKQHRTSLAILQDDECKVDPFVLQVPGNREPPTTASIARRVFTHEAGEGLLDLIPSTLDLMYVALGHPPQRVDGFQERFSKFITQARARYDVILIDCHPAGSILTKTSLANSDHVLVPVIPTQFALRGVALMSEFIDASKAGPRKPPYHIVFNRAGAHWSQDAENTIRGHASHGTRCSLHALRRFKAYADPSEGQDFVWYSKRPHSTNAWRSLNLLVDELVGKLNL